jgi:ABC-type phosphate transport system substrate-binding protein
MIHRYFLVLFLCAFCAMSALAEDIVVVVNQKNSVNSLSRDEVIDIFMGRNRQLSSGVTALPLDLPITAVERENFYLRLTGKSLSEINAYWSRLHFTGRATPPILVRNQEEALQKVMGDRNAVAYVSRSKINPQVKVVFELNDK